jgi:hypothetical protein
MNSVLPLSDVMTRTPLLVDRPASYHARAAAFRKKSFLAQPGLDV